jgi:hypothetical protein
MGVILSSIPNPFYLFQMEMVTISSKYQREDKDGLGRFIAPRSELEFSSVFQP